MLGMARFNTVTKQIKIGLIGGGAVAKVTLVAVLSNIFFDGGRNDRRRVWATRFS
jgi:hypothetical protein